MTEAAVSTYEAKEARDFTKIVGHMVKKLEVYSEALQDKVQFGPQYQVTTSQGEELSIHTIVLLNAELHSGRTRAHKTILFVAYGRSGHVVGFRDTELRKAAQSLVPQAVNAVGEIVTAVRGRGIATAIELAHFDFLQREADRSRCEITYHVDNVNLQELFDTRDDTRVQPAAKRVLVQNLEAEQDRWQALYGPSGKLGFDYSGERTWYPRRGYAEIPNCSVIIMQREEFQKAGRTLVAGVVEDVQTIDDPESYRAQKLSTLRHELLPQLKSAVASLT